MPLPTVGIILNLFDGAGNPVTEGSAVFTPTASFAGTDGIEEFVPEPVTVRLDSGIFPVSAPLLPTDLPAAPLWAWQVAFSGVDLEAFTFNAPAGPVSFTAVAGTPGVVTWAATAAVTSLPPGTGVKLSGGSLPAGVVAGTTYFVVSPAGQTLNLSATPGGSPIAFTGSGSGTLTVASYYLAGLVPVASTAGFSTFLLAPSGTAEAGQTPIATGDGNALTWGTVSASLIPVPASGTASKTGTYAVQPGELALFDLSAGNGTLLLPAAPADKTQVGVKIMKAGHSSATGNPVWTLTPSPSGPDTVNAGATPATASGLFETRVYQYDAARSTWLVASGDLPVSEIDGRYRRMVSITSSQFGAKGDGTDETAAIQAAINFATSINAATYIPPGLFRASSLTLPAGAILQGNSSGTYPDNNTIAGVSVLARFQNTNEDLLVMPDGQNYQRLYDLALDGNKNNNTAGIGVAIRDSNTPQEAQVLIERCYIHDNPNSNVYLGTNRRASKVLNSVLNQAGVTGGTGFSDFSGLMDGITVAGSDNTIQHNIIGSNHRAGVCLGTTAAQHWVAGSAPNAAAVTKVAANDIFKNLVGVAVGDSSSDSIVTNNGIDRSTLQAVTVHSGSSNAVTENCLHSNGGNGAGVTTISLLTPVAVAHIDVGPGVAQVAISDNNFGPQDGDIPTPATFAVTVAGATNRVIGNIGIVDNSAVSLGVTNAIANTPSWVTLSNAGAVIQGSGNDILDLRNSAGNLVTKVTQGGGLVHSGGGAQFTPNSGHVYGASSALAATLLSLVGSNAANTVLAAEIAAGQTAPAFTLWNNGATAALAQIDPGGGYTVKGVPGATAGARFAGGTVSGAPASGTFSAGDFVVDQTGAIWVFNGTAFVSLRHVPAQAASVSFAPADPAPTASTSLVAMGLGSTCKFTPAGSGVVHATISGTWNTLTASSNGGLSARFGTGTAPANGAAVSGTRWGTGASDAPINSARTVSAPVPFCFSQVITGLTPATAVWFDLVTSTSSAADSAAITNVQASFSELSA